MKLKKRKGAAYILIIIMVSFISLIVTLSMDRLNDASNLNQSQTMLMKAKSLNQIAIDATVEVLTSDNGYVLFNSVYPATDTLNHYDKDNVKVGASTIKIEKIVSKYFDEDKNWIRATIVTEIPDNRPSSNGYYRFTSYVEILEENIKVIHYRV